MRHGRPRHQKAAARIDAKGAVPGFDRDILDLVAVGSLRRAGVVDENVEPTIAAHHFLDHASGIGFPADITEGRRCNATGLDDRFDQALDAAPSRVHVAISDNGTLVYPSRGDIVEAISGLLQTGTLSSREMEDTLADRFGLTPEARRAKHPSGVPVWRNLLAFALKDLVEAHRIERVQERRVPNGGTTGVYQLRT